MENRNEPFGFNLRSPGTDPSDDAAAQQDFEYYQAQLRRMLEDIERNGKQFELSEDVRRLKFYLEIMEDQDFLRKCGAALVRSFIAHIHDVDRKISNFLPDRIPENSAFEVITAPSRATGNHAENAQEREPYQSLEPFRITESFNSNQFFERRQPQPGPSRVINPEANSGPDTGHWFFGPSEQDSRERQPVPQSPQLLRVPTSRNVTGQTETSFNWRNNDDMNEVTVLFERLAPVTPSGSNIEVPSIWNRDSAPRENRNISLNTRPQAELAHAHTDAYQRGPSSVNRGHWNHGQRETNCPSQLAQNQPNSQSPIQFIFMGPTYFPSQAQSNVPHQPQRASLSTMNRGVERVLRDPRRFMLTHQSDNHPRSYHPNPRDGTGRYRNTSPYHSYSRGGRRSERRRH